MSHNQLSEYAFSQLAEGLSANTKLTDFFFTHNDLQEFKEAGLELINSFSNKKDLKQLALNSCNLNGELLVALKDAVQEHTKLRELYLFANKIEKDGADSISAIIRNKGSLTSLGLSNNKMMPAGAIEIAKHGLAGKTQMVKLSIENNQIGNTGLAEISKALRDCTLIQELYLYNNELEDEPIREFTELLKNQQDLHTLGLEMNRIGYKGLGLILNACSDKNKLERVYLNHNDINT